MNKTQLYIQLPETNTEALRFGDTYLALGPFGLVLGLEFPIDVTGLINVGDTIFIDKDDKSINSWVDGAATILGITFSSIYPAPASLVFTDRPLQLPISFTSGEAGTIYEGTTIQSNWTEVDLSDNVPFPITFNIADVREINNRNGAYSKTIEIPGTKTNNDVFKYIFDIQGIDNYDTTKRVKCNIVVDTIPVLEGYIQLNSIKCDDNKYWSYEFVIFGENANFSKELLDNKLEDLDFSEFNHTFNLQSVTASWYADWNSGYHYSMIDYNYNFSINDPLVSLPLNFFRPNIYAKVIWDKIFNNTQFTYQSDFLNSDLFKSLIITTNQQKTLNTDEYRFNQTFRAGLTGSTGDFYAVIAYDPSSQQPDAADNIFSPTIIPFADDTTSPNGDPGSNFNTTTYKYTNTLPYKKQKFGLNVDFKVVPYYMDVFSVLQPVDITNPTNIAFLDTKQLRIDINLYRSKNPSTGVNQETLVSRYTIYNAGDDPSVSYSYGNVNFSATQVLDTDIKRRYETPFFEYGNGTVFNSLYSGEQLYYKIQVRTYGGDDNNVPVGSGPLYWKVILNQPQDTFADTEGTYIFNFVDSDIQIGQELDLRSSVPLNIKQVDYLTSIIKMFNLYIMPDKVDPKKLIIEPRDDFYSQSSFLDWSNKLDIDKEIIQEPVIDRKLRLNFSHKSDSDFYNKDYTTRFNRVYGDRQFTTGDEFSNSDVKIETIFSPTILTPIRLSDGGISTSIVVPKIWSKETIEDSDKNKVTGNIRILQKSSLPISTNGLNYKIENVNFNIYPFVGNIDDPLNPLFDINFDNPLMAYYPGLVPTNNNLFNLFYENYIEEVYGDESKLISCYIYLTSQDLIDFDYTKQIYISNISSGSPGYFRVNKIEYDPFNKQSYKVELIKILNTRKSSYRKVLSIGDVGVALPPNSGVSVVSPGTGNQWTGDKGVVTGDNNVSRSDSFSIVGDSNIIESQSNNTILSGKNNIIGDGSPNSFIIGGQLNSIISNSKNSGIIGGNGNRIAYNATGTASSSNNENNIIIGGYNNNIIQGVTNSFIMNGQNFTATQSNTIYLEGNVLVNGTDISSGSTPIPSGEIAFGNGTGITSKPSFIFQQSNDTLIVGPSPNTNTISVSSAVSSIISSGSSTINQSQGAVIIGSYGSTIGTLGARTSIISSESSQIDSSSRSSIIGSVNSYISALSNQSVILGSANTGITNGSNHTIASGLNNNINGSSTSAIIGGSYNSLISSNRSIILGGQFLSLTATNDSVLVPNLIVNDDISFNNVSGTATITAGTSVTVNNTYVQAGSKILITGNGNSTFWVSNIVSGTSFNINAGTSGTYTIYWLIIN